MAARASTKKRLTIWPEQILGPRPGLKELNLMCWCLFALFLLVPLGASRWARYKAHADFADVLPIDFIYFYGSGHLVNEQPPSHFYDLAQQIRAYNDIFQLQGEAWGGSPYPPLVGRIFSLYAHFDIATAYYLWLVTSLGLYLIGLIATLKVAFPHEPLKSSLAVCFALAFPPFLYFTLIVGQIATVGVFGAGLAIHEDRNARPFASGIALSVLSYKPTLLVLLVPMLLLTRRFRALAGFSVGVLCWILLSTALCGVRIWAVYARFLLDFAGKFGINGESLLKRWQYLDVYSLTYLIPGGQSAVGFVLLAGVTLAIVVWIGILFWESSRSDTPDQLLVWAVALTWTLLLNIYVPIYDSVLVVLAVMLTLGALSEIGSRNANAWVVVLGLCIFSVSIVSTMFARQHHVQLLTVFHFALGIMELTILQHTLGRKEAVQNREMLSV